MGDRDNVNEESSCFSTRVTDTNGYQPTRSSCTNNRTGSIKMNELGREYIVAQNKYIRNKGEIQSTLLIGIGSAVLGMGFYLVANEMPDSWGKGTMNALTSIAATVAFSYITVGLISSFHDLYASHRHGLNELEKRVLNQEK
jgi:hypothetical protein